MNPEELEEIATVIARKVAALISRPDDAMLDVHEVAELLNCSVPTVERLTRSGELPSVKIGRLRRYRRVDVLRTKGGAE